MADGSLPEQLPATLPTEVREHATTKTSVYHQGELIYDGATGTAVGSSAGPGAAGPGASLNEMLRWGIQNSDPAELARRAQAGDAAPPSQLDREIMDMLLGEPTVAKMRECLGKVEPASLAVQGGYEVAAAALEELEYYVEDIDNAVDMAKIGGLQALVRCLAPPAGRSAAADDDEEPLGADDLREAACGALAAALQNNPKVQAGALTAGVPEVLLLLLQPAAKSAAGAADADGGAASSSSAAAASLPVRRKALLALSALLRRDLGAAPADEVEALRRLLVLALPTLLPLASPEADLKLRRRALFLLASLAAGREAAALILAEAARDGGPLPALLLHGATDEDEDVRGQALQLLLALAADPVSVAAADPAAANALRERLLAEGCAARLRSRLEANVAEVSAGDGNADHSRWLQQLIRWVGSS